MLKKQLRIANRKIEALEKENHRIFKEMLNLSFYSGLSFGKAMVLSDRMLDLMSERIATLELSSRIYCPQDVRNRYKEKANETIIQGKDTGGPAGAKK